MFSFIFMTLLLKCYYLIFFRMSMTVVFLKEFHKKHKDMACLASNLTTSSQRLLEVQTRRKEYLFQVQKAETTNLLPNHLLVSVCEYEQMRAEVSNLATENHSLNEKLGAILATREQMRQFMETFFPESSASASTYKQGQSTR